MVGSGWLKVQYYLKKTGWEADKAAGKPSELCFVFASLSQNGSQLGCGSEEEHLPGHALVSTAVQRKESYSCVIQRVRSGK